MAEAGGRDAPVTAAMKFALLGDPVAHSLSPAIHNAAFAALRINATYEAITTSHATLRTTVARLLAQEFCGLNITTPLKEAIVDLITTLSPEAAAVRAVAHHHVARPDRAVAGRKMLQDAAAMPGERSRLQPRLSREAGEDLILKCYMSRDFHEGLDAFLNKRPPHWGGQ